LSVNPKNVAPEGTLRARAAAFVTKARFLLQSILTMSPTKRRRWNLPCKWRFHVSALLLITFYCVSAHGQLDGSYGYVFHPNQKVRVESLPSIVAASRSESDVMAASLAIAVRDRAVCCGRKSALEDQAAAAEGTSLKELGAALRGKHYLDSGETIVVADQYWSGAEANPQGIVGSLMAQCPLIMDWDGHLYVVYGALFDEYRYYSGDITWVIKKLSLVDPRFSDKRRYVSFDRQTDDWGKVTGLLALTITR
jgi:hypothetical protein